MAIVQAMKKKRPSLSTKLHHLLIFGCPKMVIAFCILFCLLAYLGLHLQDKLQSPISDFHVAHSFGYSRFVGTPKVAFLFLVRQDLPLDFLWGSFFKNGDAAKFTIYIHSEPGFVFNETTTRSAFFYGRQLNNSIQVVWGESSMIEAEKLLIEAALHDPANQRLVLLSDSCVPLYSFSYTYSYILSSPRSFVDSFIDVEGNRYSPKMSPIIPKDKWRKGSQWITLIRRHAKIVVDDNTVFRVFKKFCKRRSSLDLAKRRQILQIFDLMENFQEDLLQIFGRHRNCISDEHYVQTLLTMNGLQGELDRRSLTYTSWNQSNSIRHRRSWHPITFNYTDAAPQKIKEIKVINHLYFESENRTEQCHVGNKFIGCFLFARKFTLGAALRLWTDSSVGFYDPAVKSNTPP